MAPLLILLLFILNLFSPTIAAPGSACSSGIYNQLLGLSAYGRAESHCSAHSPFPTSNVTTTVSTGSSKRSNIFRRATASCPAPSSVYQGSANIPDNYSMIFSRTGITEDPTNSNNPNRPGNVLKHDIDYPPITSYYPDTYTECQAVHACADVTAHNPGKQYLSFELHYFISSAKWKCVSYLEPHTCASFFTVSNLDVRQGYGYSVPYKVRCS